MNEVIYFLGFILVGYMIFKLYQNYAFKIENKFNQRALLSLIIFRFKPLQLTTEIKKDIPNINYILSNIISVTNDETSRIIKEQYYNYYTKYVETAIIKIKDILKTSDGHKLIENKINNYKIELDSELKRKQLIDLQLKQNRLKYLDVLMPVFGNEPMGLSKLEFINLMGTKLSICKATADEILINLSDKDCGLIYSYEGLIHLKADASGDTISNLEKEIFVIKNELSILNGIAVDKL
ncbi:hypothetical protein [Mucilaginibacter sp.]